MASSEEALQRCLRRFAPLVFSVGLISCDSGLGGTNPIAPPGPGQGTLSPAPPPAPAPAASCLTISGGLAPSAVCGSGSGGFGPQFVAYWESGSPLAQVPQGVTVAVVAFNYLMGHTITSGDIDQSQVTAQAIAALHQRNVKVMLSLGGADPPNAFSFDGNVQGFESSLQSILAQVPYDGIDFDDESPSSAQRVSHLTVIIPATRTFLNSIGKSNMLITYPAFNTPDDNNDRMILQSPGVASALSWVNVMSYEGNNASKTESDLAAFGAVFPKNKLMLGIDLAGDLGGPPSTSSLASMASFVKTNGYGGMMIWTSNTATQQQVQAIVGGL